MSANTSSSITYGSLLLKNPMGGVKALQRILDRGALLALQELKKQTPVDRGTLRRAYSVKVPHPMSRSVGVFGGSLSKIFFWLQTGTGKYANASDAGYSTGRVRASGFYGFGHRQKAQKFFAALRKRGVTISMKPNKITQRAVKNIKPAFIRDARAIIKGLL